MVDWIRATGYYIPDDGSQHVLVAGEATPPGDFPELLSDVHWQPGQGVKLDQLVPIPGDVPPAGYYASGEGTQNALFGGKSGDVIHVYWKSSQDIRDFQQDVVFSQSDPTPFILRGYAGYYIPEEGTHHAIVSSSYVYTSNNNVNLSTVTEVYWRSGQGVTQDELARFDNTINLVGAYYFPEEGTQHVIIAAPDGTLTELYWKSGQGVKQDVLTTTFPDVVSLTNQAAGAFCSADDQTQHVVVLSADGTLTDIHWQSGQGVHQDVLTQFPSVTSMHGNYGITGYYSANDQKRHVIVATADGTLTEVYW
jgi:hypothetical protein